MSLITLTQTVQQQISAISCNASGCGAFSTNTADPNWAHIQIPLGAAWAGNQRPQYDFCSWQHMASTIQRLTPVQAGLSMRVSDQPEANCGVTEPHLPHTFDESMESASFCPGVEAIGSGEEGR